MATDQPLGVAILGFGFIGRVHAYAHLNLPLFYDPPPLRTKLIGVATGSEKSAGRAKALLDFEIATTDQIELINRDDVDIVHICTPNDVHGEALLAAIGANKHIYCEKPLTATVEEAERVAKALAGYRAAGQMTFNYRFLPATLRAKQLMEEGRLGRISHFRGAYLHAGNLDGRRPLNWKADAAHGGGVLNDLGSHVIDLLGHLLGPLEPLHAVTRVWARERSSAADPARKIARVGEDFVMVTMRTADGAPGVIEASKIATGTEDELRFEIHGEKGALRFDLMAPNWLEFYDQSDADAPLGGQRGWKRIATVGRYDKPGGFPSSKNTLGWERAHLHCVYSFLEAIAQGRPAEPSLMHGVEMQRLLGRVAKMAVAVDSPADPLTP